MTLYKYGYCSEVGIKKSVNQDSLCIKNARLNNHDVLMAVVCDGMGGLSKGELASASVIRAFSKWFETEMSNGVLLLSRTLFQMISANYFSQNPLS